MSSVGEGQWRNRPGCDPKTRKLEACATFVQRALAVGRGQASARCAPSAHHHEHGDELPRVRRAF